MRNYWRDDKTAIVFYLLARLTLPLPVRDGTNPRKIVKCIVVH